METTKHTPVGEEDNSVTSAIIRDKVGYSAELNKSQQGSALLDVVRTSRRRQVRIGKDGDKPHGKGPDISDSDEDTNIPKLKISVPENTSPDELFCSKLGLKDVCLQYSDADYESLTSYKLFQAKFIEDIKSANPNVKDSAGEHRKTQDEQIENKGKGPNGTHLCHLGFEVPSNQTRNCSRGRLMIRILQVGLISRLQDREEAKCKCNDPRLKPVTVTQPSLDLKMKIMRYCYKYFGIQLFYNDYLCLAE